MQITHKRRQFRKDIKEAVIKIFKCLREAGLDWEVNHLGVGVGVGRGCAGRWPSGVAIVHREHVPLTMPGG